MISYGPSQDDYNVKLKALGLSIDVIQILNPVNTTLNIPTKSFVYIISPSEVESEVSGRRTSTFHTQSSQPLW